MGPLRAVVGDLCAVDHREGCCDRWPRWPLGWAGDIGALQPRKSATAVVRASRRAEPDSAKIFPDLRRGASSTPCSHHLIACQKYRGFRPDPINSAALYVARLGERAVFWRTGPMKI
jgi:hypothetical protein